MAGSSYWSRFWQRRLSRRRLLYGGALAAGGLFAVAAVRCASGGSGTSNPTATGTVRDSEPDGPLDARRTFIPPPPGAGGGTFRYISFDAVVLDRYDPHQTQIGTMYNSLSAVFSKLYTYRSHQEPTWENIVPDLAESAPEFVEPPPETLTYVVKLRRGVRFHDSERIRGQFPHLAGRELTADDVIFSYERQRNRESPQRSFYYRSSQYEAIDSITKGEDDYTLVIRTREPTAPFYHFMADTNAMIIPREIVDADMDTVDVGHGPRPAERMIGTGPFMWDELKWGIEFRARRNPDWFGWDEPELGRPYLDAYVADGKAVDDTSQEALFREKKVDQAGFLENPAWPFNLKRDVPEVVLHQGQLSAWIGSRIKTDCPPFNDPRVRLALHLATDRRQVVDTIWQGHARVVGPVGGAVEFWALPQESLEALPGYRAHGDGRQQDVAEARRLFEAAGSPSLPTFWFADQPAYIPRFASTYQRSMRDALGAEFQIVTRSYPQLAEALLRGCDQAPIYWGYDNGWIDLDDWVYPYFHSRGPKNSFRVTDAALDGLLDAQRREFDIERRRALGYEIQHYLLGLDRSGKPIDPIPPGALARLDYAAPVGASVSWPYLRNRVTFPYFGNAQWYANYWLDGEDPSYRDRQS